MSLLNKVVEKGFVDAVNKAGDFVDDHSQEIGATACAVEGVSEGLREGARIAGREITKDQILSAIGKCGKSGLTGAAIDGVLGAGKAGKMYYSDIIDQRTLFKHIAQEAGCGLASSTAGTAGTLIVRLATASGGPAPLLTGMGASVAVRYAYRNYFDEVLPDMEDVEEEENEEDLEEILGQIDKVYNDFK